MIECPSCGRRQEPRLICSDCGAPLSAAVDCFSALGLPRKLSVDLPALERIYHDLSRKVHPDRFASRDAAVRTASLHATATLTRSYRTLRDPVGRGLYWLELNREKLAENNQRVPAELAELVFDVQEQLAELRGAARAKTGDPRLAAQVAERRAEIGAAMDETLAALHRNFLQWDESASDAEKERKVLTLELKGILSRISYLRTLLRDVDRALEDAAAA